MRISVVIPCHNEESNITDMVTGLSNNYSSDINEIVIVDDASSDNTYQVAQGLASKFPKLKILRRQPPCGVGRALRDGFKNVDPKSEYVLMLDADFTRNIDEIGAVIKKGKEGYDCVFGSRFLKERNIQGYPMLKLIVNRAFHFFAKILLFIPNVDLTNNFKLIRKDILDSINFKSINFSINAETGLYPVIKGYKTAEVPVSWIQRSKGMGLSDFSVFKVAHSYTWVLMKAIVWKYFRVLSDNKIFINKVK